MIQTETIKRFTVPMRMRYEDTNCYLLDTGQAYWLVDTGLDIEGNFEHVREQLDDHGLSVEALDGLIVTHLHPDHLGLTPELLDVNPELKIRYPKGPSYEYRTAENFRNWATLAGVPDKIFEANSEYITDYPYHDMIKEFKERGKSFTRNETLELGSLELEVIETTGHTPNHVCFLLKNEGILLSGDHLLPDETPNISLFPEYVGGDPLGDYRRTLKRLVDLDFKVALPGHGAPIENTTERIHSLLHHHDSRLNEIQSTVRPEPATGFQIVQELDWGNEHFMEFDVLNGFLALGETLAHLVYLAENGKINRVEKNGCLLFSRDT